MNFFVKSLASVIRSGTPNTTSPGPELGGKPIGITQDLIVSFGDGRIRVGLMIDESISQVTNRDFPQGEPPTCTSQMSSRIWMHMGTVRF